MIRIKPFALACLASAFLLGCATTTPAELFHAATPSPDPTYGYTAENPIRLGHFGQRGGIDASYYLLAGLRKEGRPLELIERGSVLDPAHPPQRNNRRFGPGLSGGLLDAYVLVPEGGGDTLSVYVDVYRKGPVYIPQGLAFSAPAQ